MKLHLHQEVAPERSYLARIQKQEGWTESTERKIQTQRRREKKKERKKLMM